jgi:hypothetical protein
MVLSFALLQPPIQELRHRGANPVRASTLISIDQFAECIIGGPCATVECLGDLPGVASVRISADVNPEFPDSLSLFALGPAHGSKAIPL